MTTKGPTARKARSKAPQGMSDYARMADLLRGASIPYSIPTQEHTGGGLSSPCLLVELAPNFGSKHPGVRSTLPGEKYTYIHRVMYHKLYGGTVQASVYIAQLCGQPRCCAPDHLQPVLHESLSPFLRKLRAKLAELPPIILPPPPKKPRIKKADKLKKEVCEDESNCDSVILN